MIQNYELFHNSSLNYNFLKVIPNEKTKEGGRGEREREKQA